MTIWIDQETNLRVNIYAPYKGRSKLDTPEIRASLGIIEIVDPQPPQDAIDNPDHYYRTEQDSAPYVVWTKKSDEQIAQVMVAKAKVQRQATVDVIIVTTASGKAFDGDETSQGRMSRAINALDPLETTVWILADNTPTMVTREELREALRLAGAAQTAVWAAPYQL
jgi:hypothetical protein